MLECKLEDVGTTYCLTASSINAYWKCSHALFDQAQLQLVDVMNPAAVHTLLQLPSNLILMLNQSRWGQNSWLATKLE